jgi:hypothetical protein
MHIWFQVIGMEEDRTRDPRKPSVKASLLYERLTDIRAMVGDNTKIFNMINNLQADLRIDPVEDIIVFANSIASAYAVCTSPGQREGVRMVTMATLIELRRNEQFSPLAEGIFLNRMTELGYGYTT